MSQDARETVGEWAARGDLAGIPLPVRAIADEAAAGYAQIIDATDALVCRAMTWDEAEYIAALLNGAPTVIATLRESERERDEARAERDHWSRRFVETSDGLRACDQLLAQTVRERDEARAEAFLRIVEERDALARYALDREAGSHDE